MSVQNLVGTIMNVSGIIRELELAGMRVVIGDDFSEYRIYRSAQKDRSPMYPMFDVSSSYIDETNGLWICGFNENDELVHTQAARMLDLSGVSLAQHLNVHRHKYITPFTTPDPDLTFYRGPEALRFVTGNVCYNGDFWLAPRGLGGPRSQGATQLLSRVLFEIVSNRFSPDYAFALVPKQLAVKGTYLRYGYCHCEPGTWVGPDQQVTEEEYLIWMNAKDISNLLSREVQTLRRSAQLSAVSPSLKSIDSKG